MPASKRKRVNEVMAVRKIKRENKEYPDILRHIYNAPEELFIDGKILASDSDAIAIVGTRRATPYGLEQCEKLSFDLAVRGITVVSGMALGIDSAAHRGAIKAGGRTIAVLGSGHNNIYPAENKKLYREIVKNGAVISEFPPDTLPFKANFPRRNRIISGISRGVIVVEAPGRSGALITADFALEQGREVFAMPGNISSAKSSGANRLIKEGAKLVENVEDILEELNYVNNVKEVKSDVSRIPSMSFEEKAIFDILGDRPKPIDEISETVEIPVNKISKTLLKLELKKLIKALPGENFVKV
ncbi:MAG: DNA-processing protein DprA [Candidatus Omnitrophota bacterium]